MPVVASPVSIESAVGTELQVGEDILANAGICEAVLIVEDAGILDMAGPSDGETRIGEEGAGLAEIDGVLAVGVL